MIVGEDTVHEDAGTPHSSPPVRLFGAPARLWTRRQTFLALLSVLLLWGVAAAIWPLCGSVVPWDSKNHFYPMFRFVGASLADREWPLWNPYHFSGHPTVADPQSLLFTPTMLAFGWLDPTPSMQLFDVVVFAHLVPGALGMIGLFRRRGWHWVGAVLAAMVFILGGSASSRLQHNGMICSYGWFPLALFFLEETLTRRSFRFGLLFASTASLMAAGRDQVAFLECLALLGAVFYAAVASGHPFVFVRDRALLFTTIAATGVLMLAVPVLLTIQFLADSNRPTIGYGIAAAGSLPPSSFATACFSNVFGSLRTTYDDWGPSASTLPGTITDRAINYLFAGTLPALLILWHGLAWGRLFAREFRFFLIVGVAALVYALGRNTPAYSLMFRCVPGVNLYRRPADATFLINIIMGLGAGYLMHRFVADGFSRIDWRSIRGPVLAETAVALVIAAIIAGILYARKAGHLADASREIGLGIGIASSACLAVFASQRHPVFRRATAGALVIATGVELLARNAGSALNAEPRERYTAFDELPAEQRKGLQLLKAELDARHAHGDRPRVEILGMGGGWQNASMAFDIEDTLGYNPLLIANYAHAIGLGANAADANLRRFPVTFSGYDCLLASLLGLEYLVFDRPIANLPDHFSQPTNATLIYGAGSMWIYRLPPTTPRVYVATHLVPIDSERILDREELPVFDRTNTALMDETETNLLEGEELKVPSPGADLTGGKAILRDYRQNKVDIDVETDRHAILVLHDVYYPGWEAFVDGERRTILRTNLLFRGVEVPPGRHRVRFEFQPLSVQNLVTAASELVGRDDRARTARPRRRHR